MIVAMLSSGSVFLPIDTKDEASKTRKKFSSGTGDHLTLRNVFREFFLLKEKRKTWCKKYAFNHRGLENAEQVYEQLVEYSNRNLGHQTFLESDGGLENDEIDFKVLKSFLAGFFRNVAILNVSVDGKRGSYRTIGKSHLEAVNIHPSSVLANEKGLPAAIVFQELVFTQKFYIRDCSAIDIKWLPEVVPGFYEKINSNQV